MHRGAPLADPQRALLATARRALLAAARRILNDSGVDALSMDQVAAAACVGVGTVYRRFGGHAGVAYALLDETERQFQAALPRRWSGRRIVR